MALISGILLLPPDRSLTRISLQHINQYEIIVSHGLTFALAFGAILKRKCRAWSSHNPVPRRFCKAEQIDIHYINVPSVGVVEILCPDIGSFCLWRNKHNFSDPLGNSFFPEPPKNWVTTKSKKVKLSKCDSMTKLICMRTLTLQDVRYNHE